MTAHARHMPPRVAHDRRTCAAYRAQRNRLDRAVSTASRLHARGIGSMARYLALCDARDRADAVLRASCYYIYATLAAAHECVEDPACGGERK